MYTHTHTPTQEKQLQQSALLHDTSVMTGIQTHTLMT